MLDKFNVETPADGVVHTAVKHDSADKHVSGEATYVDDITEPDGLLHIHVAGSTCTRGRIVRLDLHQVKRQPGVVAVVAAGDIPGVNDCSPVNGDDPVFANTEVAFHGQALFAVAASSLPKARRAAGFATIEYQPLGFNTELPASVDGGEDLIEPHTMRRGDALSAIERAPHRLEGIFNIGGQDQFYLEGQVSMAVPGEDNDVHIFCSTQHPSEVQHLVAKALGVRDHCVTVEVRRMGGAFGGKETQAAQWAVIAALVARKTGRAAKLRLDRDQDMIMTGKRHEFSVHYRVGFDQRGRIAGLELDQLARCGYSADLSAAIADRAMFHADNAYYLPNARIHSRRIKTDTVSNTAFRGFGGPQGMLATERIMDAIAMNLGKDPLSVRRINLYGKSTRNETPYGMKVRDNIAGDLMRALAAEADYKNRRRAARAFNKKSRVIKKGIALTPVKFGISFTTSHLNQAGALVHVYTDGSVKLNHGGTEMGQGLNTKVAQVVADCFGIDLDKIQITATDTSKVPNTSATAASSGADLNAMAAHVAATKIKNRLLDFVAAEWGVDRRSVAFRNNQVMSSGEHGSGFPELIRKAYLSRISLSATGYYRTPKIYYDRETASGRPFLYFAYGAAVSEVAVDTLTGESKILRVDIVHDVGRSLNPAIDMGQIQGGFVQGAGWLTSEELWWDDQGRLRTHAPSTYKIPTASDVPAQFNVRIWERGRNTEATIHRSKAVGEPPLMLAISVLSAIIDAVASVSGYKVDPDLDAPATPENILKAIEGCKT